MNAVAAVAADPPVELSWAPPAPGAYARSMRIGEWIGAPVTPLFESWLLTTMEDRIHACLEAWIGQHAPRPYHVVVNGWYFYSVNFLTGRALARSLPDVLWHAVRSPRRVAGLVPPLVRHSAPVFEREWREDLLPRYRSAVADAEARVETVPADRLPGLVDGLATLAGDYFGSIAALTGAAYKAEIGLARFHRRHLAPSLGAGHLALLGGLAAPARPGAHAVASLDWWDAPVAAPAGATSGRDHATIVAAREAAEAAAASALAGSPGRLRSFRRLLADAQHLAMVREEQVRDLTLAWPVMRRAVERMGEDLEARGLTGQASDVFFLTRAEAVAALAGGGPIPARDVAERRRLRDEQSRLVPPMTIGKLGPLITRLMAALPGQMGADPSDTALVSGAPASGGRVTGTVRVIRGPDEFDRLQPGEVLVAPMTAPAWNPLFELAAAVVTDGGSAASHASIIAREYGIPAVVGCGDATTRLRTGLRVTVDGNTGNVEPA